MIAVPLEKIVNADGGIQRLLQAWLEELEALRNDLESKALRNDRDAAVAAGRIDGFKRAVFGTLNAVYSELSVEGRIEPPTPGIEEEDDGY